MLIKIVLDSQIRVLSEKNTPTLHGIYQFIKKTFQPTRNYFIYYTDEEGDQIILDTDIDLKNYLENCNNKPKIYIKYSEIESSTLDKSVHDNAQDTGSHINETQKQGKIQFQPDNVILDEIRQQEAKIQKEQKQMGHDVEMHNARCSICTIQPILGIRYRCGVCPDFDLCEKCQQIKGHNHPLLKIRFKNQNPLKITLEYERVKAINASNLSPVHHQAQKLKYETAEQRQQIIVSYLGNLLGEENIDNYKKYSKYSKSNTFDGLFQQYIGWLQTDKQPIPKIMQWFTSFWSNLSQIQNYPII